jgi:HEAT repeat protein
MYKNSKICFLLILLSILVSDAYSQSAQMQDSLGIWWYALIFLLILAVVGSLIWVFTLKADKQKIGLPQGQQGTRKSGFNVKPEVREIKFSEESKKPEGMKPKLGNFQIDPTKFLPVFLLDKLPEAKPFIPLPVSNDEGLLSAIEQINSEEDDEEALALSIKILAAMRTRNSVDALTKVALHGRSDDLKIKAIQALASFNHESVFEPILLACADQSKRVKTYAIQALSQLNLERTDAWLRIVESDDEEKVRSIARAVIQSGFADRVFDRLINADRKSAYEAVAILALLVKGDETTIVFRHLLESTDNLVKKAILHVLKLCGNRNTLNGLYMLLEKEGLSEELKKQIDETIEAIGFIE